MKMTGKPLPDDTSSLKRIISEQVLNIQKYEEEVNRHRGEAQIYCESLQQKEEELARSKAYAERLEEMVRLLRRRQFGASSEKVKGEKAPQQLGIFNEAEALEEKSSEGSESETTEVRAHRRRGKPKRVALPADLPREDRVIDLPEDEKRCPEGHELRCIGEETSEQLDVVPAQVKVIRTIRKKYACPKCEGHVKRAPCPATAIPKSMAGPGLLAYIATSKYGDALPLYRQEHMWRRLGVDIPRATMAGWMIKVGDLLTPVLNLMEEDLLASGYVQADETSVQVLNEAGKVATSKSYMWVRGRRYPQAPPIVIFEYDPTRSGAAAKRLFSDYKGWLQADGYAGYNGVCAREGVVRLGCWAHVRRKFFEATKASKRGAGLANEAIDMIRDLYEVEKTIEESSIGERRLTRTEKSKPILDEFRKWLDDNMGKVPPQSQLGRALHYAHSEWPHLMRYIEDGRLAIDNNMVENAIRPFAVGRKNWLFSDSVAGAKASAAIYSIMISAKLNGHNEYAYLRHLLERLPLVNSVEEIEALLPHRIKSPDIPTPQPATSSTTPKALP